jgi:hypothetical protein
MTGIPDRPCIYHITHVENLPLIQAEGGLRSDAALMAQGGPKAPIGMGNIKQRRLGLPVRCHPGDFVGDYVPFYFCPRSVMLFVIHCRNHPELSYQGGQEPIVHLEADLQETVAWAEGEGRRWSFSLSNAGTFYAEFRNRLSQLSEVDWDAVAARDFRDRQVKEGKQAEFLIHEFFPWHLVRRIGTRSTSSQHHAARAISGAAHRPVVEVRPDWYY